MGGRLLRITNGHDCEPLDPMSLSGERKSKVWSVVRVSSGNFLEMYDFMVFGYYATAIGNAFFPSGNPFLSPMCLSFPVLGHADHPSQRALARLHLHTLAYAPCGCASLITGQSDVE